MPRQMNWCYIAAFLDADGAICIEQQHGKRTRIRLKWVQNADDSFVLHGIKEFLEGHEITANLYERTVNTSDNFNRKANQCMLEVGKQHDVEFVLKKIIPWLWVKDEKGRDALAIVKSQIRRNRDRKWMYERTH